MIQEKKRALGRGLESLIPAARPTAPTLAPASALPPPGMAAGTQTDGGGEHVQEIRLEEIEGSPYQPRRRQDETALQELAQSIRAQGVLQPIVLRYNSPVVGRRSTADGPVAGTALEGERASAIPNTGEGTQAWAPFDELRAGYVRHEAIAGAGFGAPLPVKYQLIAGERRWLASKLAGRTTVPAIVRQVSNEQAMELALIENLQREDLDCLEMAYAFERLSREFALTQEEMSKRTGKDRGTIANLLRLLKLPPEIRTALARRELSFGHAKELMSIDDPTVMTAAAQKVIRENMSVRQTEMLVNHLAYLGPVSEGDWKERQKQPEDPNVRAARMELESRLGCRVKIQDKNGKGKVVIEYKSLEDFDRIV